MKWVLGILLVLLIVTTKSTPPGDSQWTTTPCSTGSASVYTQLATPSAVLTSASVTSAVTPPAAVPETPFRLPDAMEEEAPDYYDEVCEAASGGDGLFAALVPERCTEYEPLDYYDDETPEVIVGRASPHPAPDNAASTSSAGRQGRGDDASRWRKTAASGRAATTRRREEIGASGVALDQFPPALVNWISSLPSWCRDWPPYGPLGVARDLQLRAFSEALVEQTEAITYQLTQPFELSDTNEQPRTEVPQARFLSTVIRQLDELQRFYQWMYEQLEMSEANGDSTPESLYRFLEVLKKQADLVESLWKWSPTMQWTCTGPEHGALGKLFWAMDRQFIWLQVFQRWAAIQYNGPPGPRRHPYWWLPTLFEDTPSFNVSQVSRNRVAGDGASGMETVSDSDVSRNLVARDSVSNMETVSDSVYTIEDICGGREPVRNVSSEAAARRSSCSVRQSAPQVRNRYQKWMFPTCVLQHISMSEHETGQLMWPGRTPIGLPETGMSVLEGRDELGAATGSSRNGLDGYDSTDVNPDESFCGEHEPHVVGQQGEEQDEDIRPQPILTMLRSSGTCWGLDVVVMLDLGSQPQFLPYKKCDDRENACKPPEICTPVSSEVTVEMPRGATLPNFPHTKLSEQDMPSHRRKVTLLVPTSCMCIQPPDGSQPNHHPGIRRNNRKINANAL